MEIKCGACNLVVASDPDGKVALDALKRHGKKFHPFFDDLSKAEQEARFSRMMGGPA